MLLQQKPTPPALLYKRNRTALYVGVTIVILVVLLSSLITLTYLYKLTEERTVSSTKSLVSSVNQTLEGVIDNIDIVLQSSSEEIGKQISDGKPHTQTISSYLEAQHTRLLHVGFLRATNDRGDLMYGQGVLSPPNNNADREYFIRLKDNPKAGLFINKPILGRVEKKWVWIFVRRINKTDGSFGGVVVAGINVDEINKILLQIPLNKNDTLVLRDEDFGLIARNDVGNPSLFKIGDNHLSDPYWEALKVNPQQGTFISDDTAINKIARTVSYLHNAKYGFYVSCGLSRDESLTLWRNQVLIVALLVFAFIAGTFAYVRVIFRSWLRQEQHYRELESGARLLKESQVIANLGSYILDVRSGLWESSEVLDQIFGIDETYERSVEGWKALIYPDDQLMMDNYFKQEVLGNRTKFDKEYRIIRHSDNAICWVHGIGKLEFDSQDCPVKMLGTIQDITESKRTENFVQQYRTVIHASLDGFWITDTSGRILEVNDAICQMYGYSREELLQMSISDIEADETPVEIATHIRKMIETGHVQFEARHKRKNGTIANVEASIQHIASIGDRLFVFIRDITHFKLHEAELSRAANYDALTGIPNRALLADRMMQAIAQTTREKNMMAVCYLDLDGFKPINDSMGHEAGDAVLVEIAKRIGDNIRGGDTIARLGGDEFVVLLLGLERGEECVATMERLLTAIAQPIVIKDRPCNLSASIGVSIFPLDHEDPDTLLRHADQSMYVAKQSGKNRFHIYDPTLDQHAREHRDFLKNIRYALEQNQFELLYQPKVNLRTKQLAGAEALIRWRHPERGLLSPAEFLRYIDNTDLDIAIGEWVTATALAQMNRWRSAGLDIEVSINISGYHMETSGFVDKLKQQLAYYPDLPIGRLQIEVLETVALNDIATVRKIIESCRELGVGFALDDFGTGYSSLSYLSGLPVETLKIDQSFVRDMLEDKGDMAIVQGILALARAFDRKTVAEGIETEDHFKVLLEMGCELGQGYFMARPMPADKLTNWKLA